MKSFIINRYNYEELFLLYVDDELSAADRKAVEDFVSQNEDLSSELEMLKHVKLTDTSIVYNEKELLYKRENGISLSNYEEYFLLSTDNELNVQERNDLEQFVLKHPALQQEFTLLEQTRLEPQLIKYAGKENLYRSERKERRIVPIAWLRMSAAAAILGIVALGWFYTNKQGSNGSKPNAVNVAINKKPEVKSGKQPREIVITTAPIPKKNDHAVASVKIVKRLTIAKNTIEKIGAGKKIESAAATTEIKTESNLAVEPNVSPKEKEPVTVEIENPSENFVRNEQNTNGVFAKHKGAEENPVLITNAVYREVDNTEDEEEKSIFIAGSEINKNKLKGLFKKAVNLFGKKGNKKNSE